MLRRVVRLRLYMNTMYDDECINMSIWYEVVEWAGGCDITGRGGIIWLCDVRRICKMQNYMQDMVENWRVYDAVEKM